MRIFEAALNAVWAHTRLTLGDVTLAAIADRVIHTTAERFPQLASLTVTLDGISCVELRARGRELDPLQATDGMRFALVELLTVLGRLTADVLTPGLHATLLAVKRPENP